MEREQPRIAPGTLRQTGLFAQVAAHVGGIANGTTPINLIRTLGRHRTLFRRWIFFAAGLMPGGLLARRETEFVILRVAVLSQCAYEWEHHVRLARRAGLETREIEAVRAPTISEAFSPRISALLRATDELHARRTMSEPTWRALREQLDEREVIELCMLVGHYEMLAMLVNSLRIQCDEPRPGRRADGDASARAVMNLARTESTRA